METGSVQGVGVLEPIGHAINKTKQILFSPFNLEKWFVLGICAWLAGLGGGGGGANFNYSFHSDSHGGSPNFNQISQEVSGFLSSALPWLIPAGIVVFFLVLGIAVLVVWLKSRGQFMFLDCIVRNRAAVSAPWSTYQSEGNSLFGFKFVVWLAAFALTLIAIIPLVIIFITFSQTDFKVLLAGPMIGAGFLVLGLFLLWLFYSLVTVLTDDFVVPVMMLRRCGVMEAWREFLALLSANIGRFLLYLLVVFAAGIALGVLTSIIAVTACCCFCCIAWVFVIPIIGSYLFTVLILPLRVWRRSYAVLFLAQFGAGYNVFATAQSPAPPVSDIAAIEPQGPDAPQNPQES